MIRWILYFFTGKVATVENIIAPLKVTLAGLEEVSKLRATQIIRNNDKIAKLNTQNLEHNTQIEHADRISEKLNELLK
jgi:hypothetical protein